VLGKARFSRSSTAPILTHSRGTKGSPGIPEDVVENPSEIIGLLFLWNSSGIPSGISLDCQRAFVIVVNYRIMTPSSTI
jgi:hypothetical protein